MSNRTLGAVAAALASLIAASPAGADRSITLDARLAQPAMKEGVAQKNYVKVALKGCEPEPAQNRPPVNVAFVIDRSGSMSGPRIAQAREAASMAISRLKADDIASVVVFDHRTDLLIPAQRVTDPQLFTSAIQRIGTGGTTAIYEGVLRGSDQVLTNKNLQRLNRVVLLSDGGANVGPSRVDDFTRLGAMLLSQGVSVSTIGLGLGYNEDLMLELARTSDGNHAFARDPSDLIQIFNREFNDVLSSCAQTVSIDIDLKAGMRAVKAVSRDGTIDGGKAQFHMNQVYAATEHYVLIEVELDPQLAVGGDQDLGIVKVAYSTTGGTERQTLDTPIRGRFTASDDEVKAGIDTKVSEVVLEQVTRARAREAVALRDKGQFEQARSLLLQNSLEINAFSSINPGMMRELFQMGQQYEAMGAAPANAPAALMSTQRKQLRELDANRAGTSRRY
jgi:Ca-activated chloride channel family protein